MSVRSRRRQFAVHAAGLWLLASAQAAGGQIAETIPQPAMEYLIRAFDRYPLVAVSEWHGSRETTDFVARLIRQPGFAGRVPNIVVEFGSARYQRMIDRYIAGDVVPREELRQVWENTTQISGVWSSPIYEEFFAGVRSFNQTVPVAKRIRVLLGDPPVDWESVRGPADEDMNDWRDAHFAAVVEQEVMRKRSTALLFIGGAHISRKVMLPNSLIHLLDARFPGKALVVSAVQLSLVRPHVARRLRLWPAPAAAEIRNTWLGAADVHDVGFALSRGRLEDDIDIVLYLGPEPFSNVPADIDPKSPFALELQRRRALHERTLPFRGGKIRFHPGSTSMTPETADALRTVAAEFHRDDKLLVLVKGHADSTEVGAEQLSRRRAEAVVSWLVRHGVGRERLRALGCGSTRPLWDSDTEPHRSANRRAEVVRASPAAGCQPPASFGWR